MVIVNYFCKSQTHREHAAAGEHQAVHRFLMDGVKCLYSEQGSPSPDVRVFTAGLVDSLGLQHDNGLGYPTRRRTCRPREP